MRRFYVDTSAFIRLSKVGQALRLSSLGGDVFVPGAVASEILADKQSKRVSKLEEEGILKIGTPYDLNKHPSGDEILREAADHLGHGDVSDASVSGDVALLALGLIDDDAVVIADDKPLRKTCKALGVRISGSIGVIIAAVVRGDLSPEEAKDTLVSMDEVGARLSARLVRKAERLIDEAAGKRGE